MFKSKQVILLSVLILFSTIKCESSQNCYSWVESSFFSLEKLENNVQNSQSFIDQSTIYWNTCSKYVQNFNEANSFFVYEQVDGEILYLAGDNITEVNLLDSDDASEGIEIQYSESIDGIYLTLYLECDNSEHDDIENPPVKTGENTYSINMKSEAGCPVVSLSQIWSFVVEYKYIFIPVLIAAGILNCFLGYKYFKATIFSVGFIFAFILVLVITSFITNEINHEYINWIVMGIALVAGIGLGAILAKMEKFGFFVLGAVGGFMIGTLLYESLLNDYFHNEFLVYLYMAGFLIVGGVFGLFVRGIVTICVTSFIGAYLLIRSLSFFIADGVYFPNEFTLMQMIKTHDYEFPTQFYYFLMGIFGLTVVGIVVQCLIKNKTEQKEVIVKNNIVLVDDANRRLLKNC